MKIETSGKTQDIDHIVFSENKVNGMVYVTLCFGNNLYKFVQKDSTNMCDGKSNLVFKTDTGETISITIFDSEFLSSIKTNSHTYMLTFEKHERHEPKWEYSMTRTLSGVQIVVKSKGEL